MTKEAQRQMYLQWLNEARTEVAKETVFRSLATLDGVTLEQAKEKYSAATLPQVR